MQEATYKRFNLTFVSIHGGKQKSGHLHCPRAAGRTCSPLPSRLTHPCTTGDVPPTRRLSTVSVSAHRAGASLVCHSPAAAPEQCPWLAVSPGKGSKAALLTAQENVTQQCWVQLHSCLSPAGSQPRSGRMDSCPLCPLLSSFLCLTALGFAFTARTGSKDWGSPWLC